ncbi:MAG: hypothetical protein E7442_08895 [Ruminococcaceae bacterium]|nr:hypothetical protein [Oscillospiraceae bacterium]
MSAYTPDLKVLIENMDELYGLAEDLDCNIAVSLSELQESLALALAGDSSAKTGALGTPSGTGLLPTFPLLSLSIHAYISIKNRAAKKKAEEALLPLYQEVLLKVQAENLQLREEKEELRKLLREAEQKNVDNRRLIEAQKQKIDKIEKILSRYNAIFGNG